MGFRYDMRDKSPQQQAIVRAKDKEDERRKQEGKLKIQCSPSPRAGDYEGVYFISGNEKLMELRVSGTAIMSGPSGLRDLDIHKWLCDIGRTFVEQVKKFEIIMITSVDVQDKKLQTDWKNLRREIEAIKDNQKEK